MSHLHRKNYRLMEQRLKGLTLKKIPSASDSIMEIRLVVNKKAHWCVVCPPTIRKTVI